MNKYEITFITKEDLKEEPVKKEIESLGGKIGVVSNAGQKQFTFPIKKETAGYYTAVGFELEPQKVLELTKKLSLKNEILRHLVITAKAVKIEAPEEKKEKKPFDKAQGEPEVTAITEPLDAAPSTELGTSLGKPKPEAIEIAPEKAIVEPLPTEIKEIEKPAEEASKEEKTVKPKKTAAKPLDETPSTQVGTSRGKSAKKAEADAKEESGVSTEDRLKALDEKLDELLKE